MLGILSMCRLKKSEPRKSAQVGAYRPAFESLESRVVFSGVSTHNAIYVWRDAAANGTPVDLQEAQRLAEFAQAENIQTILYDNWGCGASCPDRNRSGSQDPDVVAEIVSQLHSEGLSAQALYTDSYRITEVVDYNSSVAADARFDALRLNIEAGSFANGRWPGGGFEPTAAEDLDVIAEAVSLAGGLPVYVSIGHHWDELITYGGVMKPAFQHILDMTSGVDIQTAQDTASVIAQISQEEVAYANAIGKPAS